MAMTPLKRRKIRAMYEERDQQRRNERLGIKPVKTKKGKRK